MAKHGHARGGTTTITYGSWEAMLRRCRDKNRSNYRWYGAKGVIVCERWLKFENFLTDMGERPGPEYSIDRYPNKAGNYEPGNGRCALQREQTRNTSRNHIVEYDGREMTLAEASELLGIGAPTLRWRLRHGYPLTGSPNAYRKSA